MVVGEPRLLYPQRICPMTVLDPGWRDRVPFLDVESTILPGGKSSVYCTIKSCIDGISYVMVMNIRVTRYTQEMPK